jgi:hypothetical protein
MQSAKEALAAVGHPFNFKMQNEPVFFITSFSYAQLAGARVCYPGQAASAKTKINV